VVLPQLLLDPAELERFEGAARAAGADYVERVLMDARDAVVARFHRRGSVDAADPWHEQVRGIVARNGGDQVLLRYHDEFGRHLANRPRAVVITSAEGAEDETYQALVESLAQSTER
jgi:hypothetical protein